MIFDHNGLQLGESVTYAQLAFLTTGSIMNVISRYYPAEAVLFLVNHVIAKQMLYSEFQAVLDGYVPLADLRNKTIEAVYVKVNHSFCVTGAVFFTLDIDDSGFVDKDWNLPLNQLCEKAKSGPDMGAGPINMASRNQCPIEWHAESLWQPDTSDVSGVICLIAKAIKQNRLGLVFDLSEETPVLSPLDKGYVDRERQYQLSNLLTRYRNRLNALNKQTKNTIKGLHTEHRESTDELKLKIQMQTQSLLELQYTNDQLQEVIDGQADKIKGLREYFEHKLRSIQCEEKAELQVIKERYQNDINQSVESATAELKKQLQLKNVEALYRNEKEISLHDQIAKLQHQVGELKTGNHNQLLKQLSTSGIRFVTYHPGASHITVPKARLDEYLENPSQYAAKECGVDEQLYDQWLIHYHAPICTHKLDDGRTCSAVIDRVEHPANYINNESNLCHKHQTVGPRATSL